MARIVKNHSTAAAGLLDRLLPALARSPSLLTLVPGRLHIGRKSSRQESNGMRLKLPTPSAGTDGDFDSDPAKGAKYKALFASGSAVQELFLVCRSGELRCHRSLAQHLSDLLVGTGIALEAPDVEKRVAKRRGCEEEAALGRKVDWG